MLFSNAVRHVSRGLSTSATVYSPIKHVTVIGGGLMGSGIAQVCINETKFQLVFFLPNLFVLGL